MVENNNLAKATTVTNARSTVTMRETLAFCQANWLGIVLRGAVSAVILLLAIALAFAMVPRRSTFDREILVTLQENAGRPQYPNGKLFSYTDIVVPAVLDKVYRENELEKIVKFDDFCDRVTIGGIDRERAKLDAEYKVKLGKRNLTLADAAEIERTYKEAIAALPNDVFTVRFRAPSGISKAQAAQIADAIPETWFELASTLEAETFPVLPKASAISKMKLEIGKTSSLAQVEQSKMYAGQLQAVARFLTEYGLNRNFTLPSGETIRDVQNDLTVLLTYDVNLLQFGLANAPDAANSYNAAFVNGNLLDVEKRLTAVNARCTAVATAIGRLEGGRPIAAAQQPGGKDGGVLQLDGAFFSEYAQLIRNDVNNKLRSTLVQKGLDAEEERCELEALKKYYESLKTLLNPANAGNAVVGDKVAPKLSAIIDTLAFTAEKLAAFRDMITKDHLTSRRFYVPTGSVKCTNNFVWPFARIVLGLAALWALYNLIFLIGLWNTRKE